MLRHFQPALKITASVNKKALLYQYSAVQYKHKYEWMRAYNDTLTRTLGLL